MQILQCTRKILARGCDNFSFGILDTFRRAVTIEIAYFVILVYQKQMSVCYTSVFLSYSKKGPSAILRIS